jgi:hypothetical protein
MRLVDALVQAPETKIRGAGSQQHPLAAARSLASAVKASKLRYILDRAASRQCVSLMFQADGPLQRPDDLTRLPSKPFWLECYPDPDPVTAPMSCSPARLGFYVEPRVDGCAGSIRCVSETETGGGLLVAGHVEFDLVSGVSAAGKSTYRMRNPACPHLDRLLGCARLVINEDWRTHARSFPSSYADFLSYQAERAWIALPFALSFAALLNARSAFVQRPSALTRLNAARSRLGRPPLLDHVEVRLNLTPSGPRSGETRAGGDRRAPRLHFVRGHSVNRAGRTFWRTSHFRGDGLVEPTTTVAVTARPVDTD